jgi:hypothetical protein
LRLLFRSSFVFVLFGIRVYVVRDMFVLSRPATLVQLANGRCLAGTLATTPICPAHPLEANCALAMSARLAYSMLSSGRLLSQSPATIFLAPARICCACYVTLSHDIEPKLHRAAKIFVMSRWFSFGLGLSPGLS